MTHPCFDHKSRQDCPRRHAGCAATCPEWAEYEKKRNARYDEAKNDRQNVEVYHDVREKRANMYRNNRLRYPKKFKNYLGGNNNE